MSGTRRIVVHGHFYQPPREEPWLDLVPREPTAAPDHDWNARITRECYAPLARARVLDGDGRLRRVLETYAWCSFNVGPTLFRWFDQHAPAVGAAFVAGDAASRARLGFGNAIAMPYHHAILPLASRRDKVTEVRWGIRDFERRFGRSPAGMWLPETAADGETLQVLAEEGIRFTVLAPHQVEGAPAWGRPGRWRGAAGRELALFAYDGALAHDVAFGEALTNADRWAGGLLAMPLADDGAPTVTTFATDGETFGHHHRFGDLALAALIDRLALTTGTELTNYEALLHECPPTADVRLVEETSWSCAHGIERWRSDCGCRMDPATSQAWRAPLRRGLDHLAEAVHAIAEREWPAEAGDLWAVRDAAGPELAGAAHLPVPARRLLEAERHALAMFTSCGWFFDDLARLEPRIVLRHAARAIEFLPAAEHAILEHALLTELATARSNDPAKGDGLAVWRRDVLAEADGPARLAAGIAALRDVAPDALDELTIPSHTWALDGDEIVTRHRTTGREYRWRAVTAIAGVTPHAVRVTRADEPGAARDVPVAAFPAPVRTLLIEVARPMVHDATLAPFTLDRLQDGTIAADEVRQLAWEGAWRLVVRDDLAQAAVVVHAVLDLVDLDEAAIPDAWRVDAFEALVALPPSPAREALAQRLALALP